jgi:tetratricopeptide (TPR) repeat protein
MSFRDPDRASVYFRQALDIAAELGDLGMEVFTKFHMGLAHQFKGDYRQAVKLYRENITVLAGDLVLQRFGRHMAAGVLSHSWLARSLAELGEFPEAIRHAEESLRVDESTESQFAVAQACLSVGIVRATRGSAADAIAPLERSLTLSELRELYGVSPVTAPYLAYAYAQSGRLDDGFRLLERHAAPARISGGQPRRLTLLGELHRLAGRTTEASCLAQQALAESRARRQRGDEARALRLLGEIVRVMIRLMPSSPTPTIVKRWRSPRNSACAPSSLTATSVSASSTGARASATRRTSTSRLRRRSTARWG